MAEKDLSAESSEASFLVSWRGEDEAVASIGPFTRERAESLVQVYGRMYPNQTCWVQPLLQEVGSLRQGRVSRARGLPVLAGSSEGH
jgi:hypothetical protein